MNENVLTLYLKTYLEYLGRGKDSFFITITDFEQELLNFLNLDNFPEYSMAIVNRNEYSHAVALRNNPDVQKIVLFTEDCTRKIDSLKDFQEYSFFPKESQVFWKCVERACGFHDTDGARHKFVDLLRKEKKILAIDLFEYLLLSVEGNKLSVLALNEHLDMFQCFKSADKNRVSLSIPRLRKIIRNSDTEIIEKQLRPAISDDSLKISKYKTNQLIKALNEGNYQKIYEIVDYDADGLESAFKQTFRRKPVMKKEIEEDVAQYQYSYEVLLREEWAMKISIKDVEGNISDDLNKQKENGMSVNQSKEDDALQLLFEQAELSYMITEDEYQAADDQITEILSMVNGMKLNKDSEKFLRQEIENLQKYWRNMQKDEKERAKPYLLDAYCKSQKEFIEVYFGLMKFVVINNSVLETSLGELFYEKLQMLFCKEENNIIRMPFYHPVMGFYYMYLRELFEQAMLDNDSNNTLSKEIVLTMVEMKKSFFPIRFLTYQENLYEIDCENAYGKTEMLFYNVGTGIPDYQLEFNMFNRYILNYIKNHPYQPELFITIVDIGELKGMDMLFRGLSKITDAQKYVLNRVTIHIISRNETKIKRDLELYEDTVSNYPSIRFKFSTRYQGDELHAQMRDIVKNADIVILADSEYLYERPRLVPYTQSPNSFIAWLKMADIEHFLKQYKDGDNRFNILWETMQNASRNASNNLGVWSYREIKQKTFQLLDEEVESNPELEIIVLTSNVGLMRMIYRSEHYSARVDRSKGKDVLVLDYSKNNQKNHLNMSTQMDIQIPLASLMYSIMREKKTESLLSEQIRSLLDKVFLKISLGKSVKFYYGIFMQDENGQEEDWHEVEEQLEEILNYVLEYAFLKKGILAKQLREMILQECYQMADSYSQTLGVYYLSQQENEQRIHVAKTKIDVCEDELKECMESIEFSRIMHFLNSCQRIDGSSIIRFNRYYDVNVLQHIMNADEGLGFLSDDIKRNARQILQEQ